MDGGLYSLDSAEEELFEDVAAAKVVREAAAEEDDVCGGDSVLARANWLHVGDDDVEDDGEVVEREDEHLVRKAAIPHERI